MAKTSVNAARWSVPPSARSPALLGLLFLLLLLPGLAGAGQPALAPGEFRWSPGLAPAGPMLVVVSLSEQRAHVYRNGVRIGLSTISSGRPGYETPTGVFTILQKRREHYSNLYDDAPMPWMQRLTWDGIALHAGRVPGYPASHGCIRLPDAFAEVLFGATSHGMTVVITDATRDPPALASPGLFQPWDPERRAPRRAAPPAGEGRWMPERAPEGPMTLVLSGADRTLLVLRNGVEIGRAEVGIDGEAPLGERAYLLLGRDGEGRDAMLPDRPALRWQAIALDATGAPGDLAGRLRLPETFARAVHDALAPGATVIVTDEPLGIGVSDLTVLESGEGPG